MEFQFGTKLGEVFQTAGGVIRANAGDGGRVSFFLNQVS